MTANLIWGTKFGVTIAAPTNFAPPVGTPGSKHVANGGTVPNYWSYVCDNLLSADSITGFGVPSGAPLYAVPEPTVIGYGVYAINYYDGFATNDRPGVAATAEITIKDVTIRGVATKALSLVQKATAKTPVAAGFMTQLWFMIYRKLSIAPDLPQLTILYDLKLPNLASVLSANNRRIAIFDVKTNGDWRVVCHLIRASASDASKFGVAEGKIGVEVVIDNNGNGGLPLREFVRYTNYSIDIPQEEFFNIKYFWQRSNSHADLTNGRFHIGIKREGAKTWTTLIDINAQSLIAYNVAHPNEALFPTPHGCENVFMGENNGKIQRVFWAGLYSDADNVDIGIEVANFEVWDSFVDYQQSRVTCDH